MDEKTRQIAISSPYITLGQFLKLCDAVSTGGEAKAYLTAHLVMVNGEKENRRGRKLYPGDEIETEGMRVRLAAQ